MSEMFGSALGFVETIGKTAAMLAADAMVRQRTCAWSRRSNRAAASSR